MAEHSTPSILDLRETDTREAAPPETLKAVAVEYHRGVDAAPMVTASGRGHVAEQILAIAFARGIKVRQDADLVEMLSLIEVDSPIPLEAFAAVAEILAYVYQANAAMRPRPLTEQS